MGRFENNHSALLPDVVQGKQLLRHARLNREQAQKISTWLQGKRAKDDVIGAFVRLDTDFDQVAYMAGKACNLGKNFWEDDEDQSGYSGDGTESWTDEVSWPGTDTATADGQGEVEPHDLASFYMDENLDEGEDSDDENFVVVSMSMLERDIPEQELEELFAQFARVQHMKNEIRKARGFFSPMGVDSDPKGKGKGKHKGKGKGKGKSKGKGKGKYQQQRDQRRNIKGLVRLPKKAFSARVRCWTCGQHGHVSASCPR